MLFEQNFQTENREANQTGSELQGHLIDAAGRMSLDAWSPVSASKSASYSVAAESRGESPAMVSPSYRRDWAEGNISAEQALGKEVWSHLKDWDWLIEHKDQVKEAIKKASKSVYVLDRDDFLKDVAKQSNGHIYFQEGNTASDWLPWNSVGGVTRMRLYLQRGGLIPDNLLFDQKSR